MLELNKIYCMDCLEGMREIDDGVVDMILSDLPYGITQNRWDSVIPFKELWRQYKRVTKDNAAIVLTAAQPFTSVLICSNLPIFKYSWCWKKGNKPTNFLNSKKQPLRICEDIVVFYRKQCTYNPQMWIGEKCHSIGRNNIGRKDRYQTDNYGEYRRIETEGNLKYPQDLIDIPRDSEKLHPTQKPVKLFEYLIKTYTNEGELVLDSCIGSGTTAVACEGLNRNYIGFETNPEDVDLAEKRLRNVPVVLSAFV